jgi:translation elongation factor EF-Tu-like GTPase
MNAKFEVDSTFIIKGRGLVLAGWIIEGKIKTGMIADISLFPEKLTVQGVEMITTEGARPDVIGLLFPLTSEHHISLWKALDIKGRTVELLHPGR